MNLCPLSDCGNGFNKIYLFIILVFAVGGVVWGIYHVLSAGSGPTQNTTSTNALVRVESDTCLVVSKFELVHNLKEMGLYKRFDEWLEKSDLKAEFDAAQVLKTDNPLFQDWRGKAQKALGLDDVSFTKLIHDSVDKN